MPRHVSDSWGEFFGPGALPSALFAFATAALGLGIPVLWRLSQVLAAARRDERQPADAVLVLGRTLGPNQEPTAVFRARLEHGLDLYRAGLAPRLIVAGGLTGSAALSEAAVGKGYLLALGAPDEAVLTEDRSRHTLDNLRNVRELLRSCGWQGLIIVSDPLHQARIAAFARGLSLRFQLSPAAASPPRPRTLPWFWRAFREALLLHWYHVGVTYSRAIRSERLLARVR